MTIFGQERTPDDKVMLCQAYNLAILLLGLIAFAIGTMTGVLLAIVG